MKCKTHKYHYFYKITNLINNHFYYGIHSTNNLNDGYMGSGTRLRHAYDKYGIENFSKSIIKFFDSREDCARYESEVVSEELVNDSNCYNVILGGDKFTTIGTVAVRDKNGNTFQVSINDPRYINGELECIMQGHLNAKDANNNIIRVNKNDLRLQTGELVAFSKYCVLVKDTKNKFFLIPKDDPRYINGELKPFWQGRKHRSATIEKMKTTHKLNNHQQGEKNSQYNTCWITKDNENKKIKNGELPKYLELGWKKGRQLKKTIHKY